MTRLAKLVPAALGDEARALYDRITGGPRVGGPFALTDGDGGLEGPFNAMLLSPRLGGALQDLGGAIRYGSDLPPRAREIAILVVARQWDSAFERYAHEAVGRRAGLTEAELTALREGTSLDLADPVEAAVLRAARGLVADGDLSDEDYAAATGTLGEALLFELTTLVGYYATLALQLRVFRVAAPAG